MGSMQSIWDIRRAAGDAKIAGLCGGVAEKWSIDPLLVRVGAAVLALSGGLGAVVYAAGWLMLPKKGETESVLERRLPGARGIPRTAWLVITAVTALIVMATIGSAIPIGTGPVIAIAAVWYFFFHRPRQKKADQQTTSALPDRTTGDAAAAWQQRISEHMARQNGTTPHQPAPPAAAPGPPRAWTPAGDQFTEPTGWAGQLPPTVPEAVRMDHRDTATFFAHPDPAGLYPAESGRRSATAVATPASTKRLTKVAAVAAIVVLGGLGVLDGVGALTIGLATYASAALLVAAVTLVASAWMGRPKGLVAITAVLALLSVGTQAPAPSMPSDAPPYTQLSGPVSELPTSHEFSTGDFELDLTNAEIDADTDMDISSELGTIRVVLPREGNVRVVTSNELGEVRLPDHTVSGADQNPTYERIEDPDAPTLELTITNELGTVEVVEP